MRDEEYNIRNALWINGFQAEDLLKILQVHGETHDVKNVEVGLTPDRYVKIVFGRRLPQISDGEIHTSATMVSEK